MTKLVTPSKSVAAVTAPAFINIKLSTERESKRGRGMMNRVSLASSIHV